MAPLVLAAALLVPSPARACAPSGTDERAPFPLYADTLTVQVSADHASYRRGDRLRLTVAVSRAAAGRAVVPSAANVEVQVTTPRGRVLRRFAREAADDGTVTFSWLVPRTVALGDVHAHATALHALGPNFDCYPLVYERGAGAAQPLARIEE